MTVTVTQPVGDKGTLELTSSTFDAATGTYARLYTYTPDPQDRIDGLRHARDRPGLPHRHGQRRRQRPPRPARSRSPSNPPPRCSPTSSTSRHRSAEIRSWTPSSIPPTATCMRPSSAPCPASTTRCRSSTSPPELSWRTPFQRRRVTTAHSGTIPNPSSTTPATCTSSARVLIQIAPAPSCECLRREMSLKSPSSLIGSAIPVGLSATVRAATST